MNKVPADSMSGEDPLPLTGSRSYSHMMEGARVFYKDTNPFLRPVPIPTHFPKATLPVGET